MVQLWIKPAKRDARFSVEVQPTDSIADLKKTIATLKGNQAAHLRLIYQGAVLRDEQKLAELNLSGEAHLILHVRQPQEPAPAVPKEALLPLPVNPIQLPAPANSGPISNPGALFNAADVQNILHNLSVQFGVQPAAAGSPAQAQAASSPPVAAGSGGPVQVPITSTPPQQRQGPPQSVFDMNVDAGALSALQEMGFSEVRARKALLVTRGNVQVAMEWLFDHVNDADIDSPTLPERPAQSTVRIEAPPAVPQGPRASPEAEQCINRNVCTIVASGRQYIPQYYFHCYTCGFNTNEGCCTSCIRNCHRGHNISPPIFSTGFYCDCGAGARVPCKSLPPGFHLQ